MPTSKASTATPTPTPPPVDQQQLTTGAAGETFWEKLTSPFPVTWIEKLPKQLLRNDENKGRCSETAPSSGKGGPFYSADGHYCGGYHARSVHLDYVGHAGITMRLNEVCTPAGWEWEPMVVAKVEGGEFPAIPREEFWIWLKIKDPETQEWIRKQGVGDDYRGSSKQAIGDAIRNAAMRFGIGTYLWSKSEYAAELAQTREKPAESQVAQDFYVKVQQAWNRSDHLRVLYRQITEAQVGSVLFLDPAGEEVPLAQMVQARVAGGYEAPDSQDGPQEPPDGPHAPHGHPGGTTEPAGRNADAAALARAAQDSPLPIGDEQ
jgi:hypothetical protein